MFRARFEDAWRGALDGEGVEAAAGDVEEAVTGRPHDHNYDGVDDAGEGGDANIFGCRRRRERNQRLLLGFGVR